MISHHDKCIFIHVPKAAGQSIERVFLDRLGLTWETRAPLLLRPNDRPELGPPRLAHLHAADYVRCKYVPQEMFDSYFSFAFVRDPWSRMVSMYKFLGYSLRCDFKTFLVRDFRGGIFTKMRWFVGPQCDFVCGAGGEVIVDFVGRFEELQSGFDHVCRQIGLPPTTLPHVNEASAMTATLRARRKEVARRVLQRTGRKPIPSFPRWQDYYDAETVALVADLYRRDIELFGYEFG